MAGKRKTRKPTHLPSPRGRRGHKAVNEQPGLREWLTQNYCKAKPKPTLKQLMEKLKGTGFSIGRTAAWEFDVEFQLRQIEKDHVLALAKAYNESGSDGQVLDIETAIATFGSAKIFQELLEAAGDKLTPRSLELLETFRGLQSSSSQRERTKFAVDRGVRRTAARIKREVQELLQKRPEELKALLKAIDQAAAEVRA
jgi:hypothetical protein